MKEIINNIVEGTEHEMQALYETVRDYESDTFSASASKLTPSEIVQITCALINHALREMSDTNTLDGVRLTEELENIREDGE